VAPGFYARQDTATPMRIAACVLVFVQVLNYFLVPSLQHAALTLSISIGAVVNALWLLVVLVRRGSYRPSPGWGRYLLQVIVASALLAVFLGWGAHAFDWTGLRAEKFKRIWLLALMLSASATIYFIALWATGLKVRKLLRH
jgi:putative peptidoglycan lipid II flippase